MNAVHILIALQLLDMATTMVALRNPKLVESNRFLVKLFDILGVAPTLILVKSAFVALVWAAHPFVQAGGFGAVLWLLCVFYAWVVWNNVKLIRSH